MPAVPTSPEGEPWQAVEPARVPRRFGMGMMLLFTVLYAVLFALLRALDAPPLVFAAIGLYVTAIGLAQMLLFGGKRPREASVLVGSSLHVAAVNWIAIVGFFSLPGGDLEELAVLTGFGLALNAIVSVPLAYVVGCIIAGVFLVLDRLRTGQWNAPPDRGDHEQVAGGRRTPSG